MGPWTVREALVEDIDAIVGLLRGLYEAMGETSGIDPETFPATLRSLLADDRSHLLVAEHRGEVLGFVSFSVRRTCMHPGGSALVDELAVDGRHRGQGVGRVLIEAVVERSRALGLDEVEVSTELSNERARRFYGTVGFEEIGVLLERDL
jgi:ribosomal protein S18 acetylase RimI-like enzyme